MAQATGARHARNGGGETRSAQGGANDAAASEGGSTVLLALFRR